MSSVFFAPGITISPLFRLNANFYGKHGAKPSNPLSLRSPPVSPTEFHSSPIEVRPVPPTTAPTASVSSPKLKASSRQERKLWFRSMHHSEASKVADHVSAAPDLRFVQGGKNTAADFKWAYAVTFAGYL